MFTRAISQEEKRSREKLASISPIYYYHYQVLLSTTRLLPNVAFARLEDCFESTIAPIVDTFDCSLPSFTETHF